VPRLATTHSLAIALLVAVGCHGPQTVVTVAQDDLGVGAPVEVLVASSRQPVDAPVLLSADRADGLSFARFEVLVPPERTIGTVTLPRGSTADPATDFLVRSASRIPSPGGFVAAVDAALGADGVKEAIIYAHGYNTTFAEGLYRQAQIAHDFGLPDVPVHYAWSSAGSLRGYVYDKESAIFAAEGLAELVELVAESGVEQIALSGHSMGGLVVMEALRLLALRDSEKAFSKLHAVVLLAPDVDVDIFRQRMAALEGRDLPVYVFASSRDRALRVSARLQGRRPRLGALTDEGPIADLPVYLIDVTDVQSADPYNHSTVAASPLMVALLEGLQESGIQTFEDVARGNPGLIEAGAHGVEQATRVVVDPFAAR
jgi:esterase/lipase superfamily enzyme